MTDNSTPKWTPEIPIVPGWYWMRSLASNSLRRVYMPAVLVRVRVVHEQANTYAEYFDPTNMYEWIRPRGRRWLRAPQALWWPTPVAEPPDDLNLSVDDSGSEPPQGATHPLSLAALQAYVKRLAGQ